jgi:hypothetical protein
MTFVTIAALLVAALVGAPLAAHMLRRRHAEEIEFAAAKLVPPTPPAARRRSKLEDRALFSVRALAVIALALLGATPFFHCSRLALNRRSGASVALAIVLDDSLSMRAPMTSGGPSRFERAKRGAHELLEGLAPGDAVAVVLAGSPARIALASTTNVESALAAIDTAAPSDRATDLDGGIRLAKGLLRGMLQVDRRVVVLSDLADGAGADAVPIGSDEDLTVWVPLPELASGSVEDCGVVRADRSESRVFATIVCSRVDAHEEGAPASSAAVIAGAPPSRSLELRAGDKVLASTPLPPGEIAGDATRRMISVALDLPPGSPDIVRAGLTGSDAIAEDDEAVAAPSGGALPMAIVVDATTARVETGGAPPIEQALAAMKVDAQVRPLPTVPEHSEELATFAAMVVDDTPGLTPEVRRAVASWVERGGVLFLPLGPRAVAAPIGSGFSPLVPGVLRWGASPAKGIDATSASSLGPAASSLNELGARGRITFDAEALVGADIVARWEDGAPFLIRRAMGRGAVLAMSLPLSTDESDLALRPGFLALLERFVATARARGGARRIDVGEVWTFDGYKDVDVARVSVAGKAPREPLVISKNDARPVASPSRAGLYELRLDGDSTTRVAVVPEREIDLRARRVRQDATNAALGGSAAQLDASPYIALALLALMALELILRLATKSDATATA